MLINIRYVSKFGYIKRLVSIATAFSFMMNAVVADFSIASVETQSVITIPAFQNDSDTFVIPSYLGYVKDKQLFKGNGRTVIHIQDAHCNYKAQQAIYELIDYLSKKHRVKVINLEGGEGRYDLSRFNGIKDNALREKTADYFLREGIISGPEFYSVKNPNRLKLWGVEDTTIYKANLDVYRKSLDFKSGLEASLKTLSYNLSLVKSKAYSKPLIELDLKANSFRERSLGLREYSDYLMECAHRDNIDVSGMVNLDILRQTVDLEKGIDFKKSGIERDELMGRLARYLPKAKASELAASAVAFGSGRMAASEFYLYLIGLAKSADIGLDNYDDLVRYGDYMATYDRIKNEELFEEISALEDSIKGKLFSDVAQRDLDRITKELSIIKGIFNITITPAEFKLYTDNREDFNIEKIARIINDVAIRYGLNIKEVPGMADVGTRLSYMERFYNLSYKRDESFVRNIKGEETVILVTGGFHSKNLARLFRDKKMSYVSVIPNFRLDKPCPLFQQTIRRGAGFAQTRFFRRIRDSVIYLFL